MAAQAAITVAKPPMIATITSVFTPNLGFSGRTATTAFGNRLSVWLFALLETTRLIAE
jgi:hypothetical protein